MKLGSIALFMVMTTIFIAGFVDMSIDLDRAYSSNQINESIWSDKFNKNSEINQSLKPIESAMRKLESEDGFFKFVLAGTAIATAVIKFPLFILEIIGEFISGVTTILKDFGVPSSVIFALSMMIVILILTKLVGFLNKTPS